MLQAPPSSTRKLVVATVIWSTREHPSQTQSAPKLGTVLASAFSCSTTVRDDKPQSRCFSFLFCPIPLVNVQLTTMSVRVVARIRPLLETELDKDVIVRAEAVEEGKPLTMVKIPSPKNGSEEFSFAFNGVYDQATTQEELFTAEVAPHVKALFQGLDLTIFAYGVTGTGKTHTMRGGMKLAERGVIPRLLSNVFRRGKKIAKDSNGETQVDVALSYYEIYNDKVFDLLEPPEKRTPSGLPLREKDGKTIVVGLSERSCEDLRDFERIYIESNSNRITAATKLNAHSSRSHAILRVKVTQTTGDMVQESTASAIDLAGSEDNRRTDNGKERLVESAAINKSLFVLSQCVDAISRGDKRIPYRESKMTRILSLGQNNGITIMILNLAPMRSYHLDTLSSLNVSSRAKRIEVREIENEVVFKQQPRTNSGLGGNNMQRQPLRPLANAHNVATGAVLAAKASEKASDKPVKLFSVYTDKAKSSAIPSRTIAAPAPAANTAQLRRSNSHKRPSESADALSARPTKLARPTQQSLVRPTNYQPAPASQQLSISAEQIEAMVEKKVAEILASRAAVVVAEAAPEAPQPAPVQEPPSAPLQSHKISEEVRRRLEALERRIDHDERDDARSDGLRFLLQARQAKEKGDDEAALRFYEQALPFFPGQAKLLGKIDRLRAKLGVAMSGNRKGGDISQVASGPAERERKADRKRLRFRHDDDYKDADNNEYDGTEADVDDEDFVGPSRAKANDLRRPKTQNTHKKAARLGFDDGQPASPRTKQLLGIINSRDLALIRGLHGFGAKKAQDLVDHLNLLRGDDGEETGYGRVDSLAQLRLLPGMGSRTVERAYDGLMDVDVAV
ncbi:P-loop containing nucleoside triphosphate hydrolase protein [Podospora didyma]|uniref:P-loop containing nucleoside triphosphate hydrolase protein n=1 Tax=Podospora didyma TaxID=330526 RepID=A0AAE0K1N9_9PEZI|nr:P-loop containing nucleoside triphosphate hydrolase protein [Podospora didyma]